MSCDYVIFLNKNDLFREKLRAGIQFSQFVSNYGNQKNDYENIVQCKFSSTVKLYEVYYNRTCTIRFTKNVNGHIQTIQEWNEKIERQFVHACYLSCGLCYCALCFVVA